MPKKKGMTNEERLKKKRECEQRRRERIKQNAEQTEALKKKKHEIYIRLKAEGKVKTIGQLTEREKRATRKKWAENKRVSREKNKIRNENQNTNNPPESENVIVNPSQHLVNTESLNGKSSESRQKIRGRKTLRKNRAACYRRLKYLERQVEELKRSKEKYRKRLARASKKNPNEKDPTPRKQVKNLLTRNKGKINQEIRRELFFAASMRFNLKQKYKELQSQREKQIFTKVIGGQILKKYRILKQCSSFLPRKLFKSNAKRLTTFSYERMKKSSQFFIKSKVQKFLESDENSKMCPGKRDVVRQNGESKQKRILNGSLREMHKKFVKSNVSISYALFCKIRPWWVVKLGNVSNRNTCLCVKHENLRLLIKKLGILKLIEENSTYDVIEKLLCDSKERTECCYLRTCTKCENNVIKLSEFIEDIQTDYQQWKKHSENRISNKTKKEITVNIVSKQTIQCSTLELVNTFLEMLNPFLLHEMKINHQFLAMKELKQNLTSKDLVLHIDFSENYLCKYESEVQSVHFGASRQQICLHTGVAYSKDLIQSFCTVSEVLDHNAPAVMAHIKPVLQELITKKPDIENLHFISDSVSAQYRNKTIFNLMQERIPSLFPKLKKITWNYTEAGHGKGAPDGVGGTVKRIADEAVCQGQDIYNFETFFELLRQKTNKILCLTVTEEMIEEERRMIEEVSPLKGTMDVHQACWLLNEVKMKFRRLSCFSNQCEKICIFYHLSEKSMQPTSKEIDIESCIDEKQSFKLGDWVAVAFQDNWYPGKP